MLQGGSRFVWGLAVVALSRRIGLFAGRAVFWFDGSTSYTNTAQPKGSTQGASCRWWLYQRTMKRQSIGLAGTP